MKNLIAGFAVALLIVCAVLLFLQHQAREKLRAEDELLRQQIAQLKMDNENLSNLAAQTKNSQSLPDEQFAELLKLRGEVGVLRRQLELQKARTSQLAQAVQQSALLEKAKSIPLSPSAFISTNQLTNAGLDTPEATVQTYFHGMFSDNYDQVVSTMSSQIPGPKLDNPKDREDFEKTIGENISTLQGIQMIAKKTVSDDKVDMEVMVFQEGKAPDMSINHMVKEGNQWKYAGSASVSPSWSSDGQVQPITPNQ
jgi:hypothetical protein